MSNTPRASAAHDRESGSGEADNSFQRGGSYKRDDLHLRTVTTLLRLFNTPDQTKYKSSLPSRTSKNFKKMLAVSTLLARGAEVVACIPHRTVDTTTLFCLREGRPKKHLSEDSHFVSKNGPPPVPRDSPPPTPIKLLQVPEVKLDQDIVSYLVTSW
jgi:hypothetical protein